MLYCGVMLFFLFTLCDADMRSLLCRSAGRTRRISCCMAHKCFTIPLHHNDDDDAGDDDDDDDNVNGNIWHVGDQ